MTRNLNTQRIVTVFLLLLSTITAHAQQHVDFGIFASASPGQAEIRIRPSEADTRYLTNMQFTVRWPASAGVTVTAGSPVFPYLLTSQGQYLSNGFQYLVFATPGGFAMNWQANVQYICATFTYSTSPYVTFEIADDAWTLANNGDYYAELNGSNVTGILYNPFLTIGTPPVTTHVVQGHLSYHNSQATSLHDVTVSLVQNDTVKYSDTTDIAGNYAFPSVNGGTYHVVASSTHTFGGVNSLDALLIQKHFSGFSTLQGLFLRAGDVNNSGFLNSGDALLAAKRFVHLVDSFAAGDWVFDTLTVNVTTDTTLNLKGLCTGDVNGSYNNPNSFGTGDTGQANKDIIAPKRNKTKLLHK